MTENNKIKITMSALIRILVNLSTTKNKLNIQPGKFTSAIMLIQIHNGPDKGGLIYNVKEKEAMCITERWFLLLKKKKEESIEPKIALSI